jgi:demethylmenaquinone methyltransferase/2-methoxy-6-polyprenyl-1,4-benzoquinol methylase
MNDASPSATFGYQDVDPAEKPRLVRGVFDRVAGRYDLMNDLMSAGVHRVWKDMVAARLNPQPGEVIVDCAGGTGDMARRFARLAGRAQRRRGGADVRVLVVDYNAEMIAAGRARGGEPELEGAISWAVGDAQRLPLGHAMADAYCIAFGIRNVTDIGAALREARRVLKPGGRFACLEFSRPTGAALQGAYDAWSFNAIPAIGAAVAGDRASYQYPGGEHPAVSGPADLRGHDEGRGLWAGGLDQLHGRGGGAAHRLGGLVGRHDPADRGGVGARAGGRPDPAGGGPLPARREAVDRARCSIARWT